jgi:hypothetical protein
MNSGPIYCVGDLAINFKLTYLQVLKSMILSIIQKAFQFRAKTIYNRTIGTPATSKFLTTVIHGCQKWSRGKCVRKLMEARTVHECSTRIKLEMVSVTYQSLNIRSAGGQSMACLLIRSLFLFKASNSKV